MCPADNGESDYGVGGAGNTAPTSGGPSPLFKTNFHPPQPLEATGITLDRAKALAVTRRSRVSDFALGGLIGVASGAFQTITNVIETQKVPSNGELVELGIAIVFATLTIRSLADFSEPISSDLLKELFPDIDKRRKSAKQRLKEWWSGPQ